MKKIYKCSRIILSIISFLTFTIIFMFQGSDWLVLPPAFALITYAFSFPSSIVSKILFNIGDKIENKLLKVLYYIFLPIFLIFVCIMMIKLIYFVSNNFVSTLGQAIMVVIFMMIVSLGIVLPYIQTLVVLVLKKIEKFNNI